MMTMTLGQKPSKWRKVAVSCAVGGVVGFSGSIALMHLYYTGAMGAIGLSELAAMGVGAFYAVVAALVGFGLVSPGVGAQFLNVEDAEELREQRRLLACSAAGMAAMGAMLVVLALAGEGGVLPPHLALAGALALWAVATVLTIIQWRYMDELMRGVTQECASLAFYVVLVIGGGWAMLAHLGFRPAPSPLDWLTMFYGFTMVAAFIAAGRRGMVTPR